jgi:DtxR family transcriptional regulator, iron-dependent repressor
VKATSSLTTPVEDCLIAIATLRDDQVPSIPARIAERLDVSLSSVGETLKRLERDGYVVHEQGREYGLSASGQEVADKLMRRHRLIERWLTDVLHLDWATAHTEAHRLEHAVSDIVAEKLARSMGYPDACPHGNPIVVDHSASRETSQRLTDVSAGTRVDLRRISEVAEDNTELMIYYEREGFRPGARIEVKGRAPLGSALDVELNGKPLTVATEVATYLWVTPSAA